MSEFKELYLSEYMPKSELVVEEHEVLLPKFPVIDVHTHFGSVLLGPDYEKFFDTEEVVKKFKSFGVKNIVNLDGKWGDELIRSLNKIHPHEDFIITFGSIDVTKLDDSDFESYVRKTLHESKERGIRGLKFLKDVSLVHKDKSGKYIAVDDPRLQVIWATAAELGLPVLIHIADPVAFFRPVDRFNERYEELSAHPNWSYHKPGMYTFEELLDMQENLLESNPDTTFIIAHCGSYPENLGYVARSLDRYPNMYVDIGARIAELGRQPYSARKFFIKYQDRILFATDVSPLNPCYPIYYRFLETWDEYFDYSDEPIPPQGRWKIYGIGLEDEVLEKVYYKNAEKVMRITEE
ncbi:MAG: amidohydrolase [Clostridiales bacterium]|nr:amidohydrolase [Clostridiales bacterium]